MRETWWLPVMALLAAGCGAAVGTAPSLPIPHETGGTETRRPEITVAQPAVQRQPARTCGDYPEIQRVSELAILAIPTDGKPTAIAWKPQTTPDDSKSSKELWQGETRHSQGVLTAHNRKGISIRVTRAYKSGYYLFSDEGQAHYSLLTRLELSKDATRQVFGTEFIKPHDKLGVYQAEQFTHGEVLYYMETFQEPEWSFVVARQTSPALLAKALTPGVFGEVLRRNYSCARNASPAADDRIVSQWTGILGEPKATLFVNILNDNTAEVTIARTEGSHVRVMSYHAGGVRHVPGVSLAIGEASSELYFFASLQRADRETTSGRGLLSWRDEEGKEHQEQVRLLASLENESWTEVMIEALTTERSIEEWWEMEDRLIQRRIDQMDRAGGPTVP